MHHETRSKHFLLQKASEAGSAVEKGGGGEGFPPSAPLHLIRVWFLVFPGGMESGRACLFLKADNAFLHPKMAKGDRDKEILCLRGSYKEPCRGFHLKYAGQMQLKYQELWIMS